MESNTAGELPNIQQNGGSTSEKETGKSESCCLLV